MRALNIESYDEQAAHNSVELFRISGKMKQENLPEPFIAAAIRTALDYEGVSDLVFMWDQETEEKEKEEIIADIQEMIEVCQQKNKSHYQPIKLNDLESVAKDIRTFKDSLLEIVINKGGIGELSKKTNIPQPSLSRFFNSNSMPRRATLIKIAKALGLDAIAVESKWIR